MIISELILTSFGKFKNKNIELEEGFNLIYGRNEEGKTTIHKFIEGMFYGFFNPFTKTKRYTDDYYKYIPWDGSDYKGILQYKYKENTFIIERNFLKGYDEVKVFDKIDGQDVSYLFPYDNISKLIIPAYNHMDLNNIVYKNTISIGQLNSKTDENLSKEVKDSLINLGGSLDEDISVKKVIDKLSKQIDEIGTKNREKSSPYGRDSKELKELLIEKSKALVISKEIKKYQFELNSLYNELENLNILKREIKDKINKFGSIKELNNYNEALSINEEIEDIKNNIALYNKYSNISFEDYNNIIELESSIKNLKITIKKIEDKINTKNNKLEELDNKKMDEDSYNIDLIQNRIKKYKINHKKITIFSSLALVFSVLTIIIGIKNNVFLYLSFIPLITSILLFIDSNKIKLNIKNLNNQVISLKNSVRQSEDKIKNAKKFYKVNIEDEVNEHNNLKIELSNKRKHIESILQKNNLLSTEDFKDALKYKNNYDNLTENLAHKKIILEKILKNKSLHELKKSISDIDSDLDLNIDCNIDELNSDFSSIQTKILEIEKRVLSLKQKIEYLSDESRELNDINEDILEKESTINKYENKLESLNYAINTIEKISRDIQKDFAPKLNNKVSEIIKFITNGKYNGVKINEDLSIKISNTTSNNLIDIEKLSGGTIDQFYFASRLAIVDIIKNNNRLPLILDDSFIQYDDYRLKKILKFLINESKNRQIILFTCQNREKNVLDSINSSYNYIELR